MAAPNVILFSRIALHGTHVKPDRPAHIRPGDAWDGQPTTVGVYTCGTHRLTLEATTWEEAEFIASNETVTVTLFPNVGA